MVLQLLTNNFTVCQIPDLSQVDTDAEFYFISRTDEELSLVCDADRVPGNVLVREDGWRALRIQGVLEFSMVGILAEISSILAEAGVSIFAISTYKTDYILVKGIQLGKAIDCLRLKGCTVD